MYRVNYVSLETEMAGELNLSVNRLCILIYVADQKKISNKSKYLPNLII